MGETRNGVIVGYIAPGGPAEAAGLKEGDIVLAYDGEPIRSVSQLITLVQRTRVGRAVPILVRRDGAEISLEATIAESQPEMASVSQGKTRDPSEVLTAIGVEARDLTTEERYRGLTGVVVANVRAGSLASGRLEAGDLIVGVNQTRVTNTPEFYLYLSSTAAVQAASVQFFRDGIYMRTDLPVLPRKEEKDK